MDNTRIRMLKDKQSLLIRGVLFCACLVLFTTDVWGGDPFVRESSDEMMQIRQMNALDAVEKRDIRDPFWPVGFYPDWWRSVPSNGDQDGAAPFKPDKWTEARKQIKISGMSRMGNSGYFAVINGKTVTEGDVISVSLDGTLYRWSVTEISEKGLKLTPLEN